MKYLFTLTILFAFLTSFSHEVTGKVIDEDGYEIPFTSVFVDGSTYGVATNLKGDFFMHLDAGEYTLVFRNIEFAERKLKIVVPLENKLEVVLEPISTELDVVTITSDTRDPAYEIIENAIKKKKVYLKQFNSYKCNTYSKCSLEKKYPDNNWIPDSLRNTKQHQDFIEKYSELNYEYPNKYKEVVLAYNDYSDKTNFRNVEVSFGDDDDGPETGDVENNIYLFRQNITSDGFNFYQNLINIPSLGHTPYTSPISSTAKLTYKYRWVESFVEDGRTVNKIQVIPRNKESAAFKGYIFINDSTWNIKAVDLSINKSALYMFKSFHVAHQYKERGNDKWVLAREEYFYDSKEGKVKILGNTILIHSDYQLDFEYDRKFFGNELKLVVDDAYEKDTSFWKESRPIELKERELEFIHYQDSVVQYHGSEEYLAKQDSIYNKTGLIDIFFSGIGFRNTFKKRELFISPLIEQPRPFGVGGYRHTLGVDYNKEFNRGYMLETSNELDYGFNNKDLKGSTDNRFMYNPKKFGKIHFKIGDTYEMLNTFASITATFSRSNYVNKKGGIIGHGMEFFNGFYADIDLEYYRTTSISDLNLTGILDTLFGSELDTPEDFDPFSELFIDTRITYKFKQKYYTMPYKKVIIGSKYPELTLWYRKGIKGVFNSVVDFDFVEIKAKDDIQLGTMGMSKWTMTAGRYLRGNNIQPTHYRYFRGSDLYFLSDPLQSFQLLGEQSLTTIKGYVQANYIHHFNGAIMNKIPLINKLGLLSVAGAAGLLMEENNFRHLEAFAGIEKPFRLFGGLVKVGAYYVVADSNVGQLQSGFKIGFDFFDPFKNKWSY